VAHVAFGTAIPEDEWDAAFYPGAARWEHPDSFLAPLEKWLHGDNTPTYVPRAALRALSVDALPSGDFHPDRSSAETKALLMRVEEAIQRIAELETPRRRVDDEPTIDEMHMAIWEASESLRR
jgi:hypothetical protein